MAKLEYSPKGIPQIVFAKNNYIGFNSQIKNDVGYKYMTIKADIVEEITIKKKNGNGKETGRKTQIAGNELVCVGVDFKGIPTSITKSNPYLTAANVKKIRNIIKKYVNENGIFPYGNVEAFALEVIALYPSD
jgi:hypothetical protein